MSGTVFQSSFFGDATEQEVSTALSSQPTTSLIPVARPVLDEAAPLDEWVEYHHYGSAMGELVLRAKHIEANHLMSADTATQLAYLREHYGDEGLMKAQIEQMGEWLRNLNLSRR